MRVRGSKLLVAVVLAATTLLVGGCSRGCAKLRRHEGHRAADSAEAASARLRAASAPASSASTEAAAPIAPPPPRTLTVPKSPEPIHIDGELDENAWRQVAVRSGNFHDEATNGDAIPYSDARFLRDDAALYVVLYAADQDLRSSVTAHDGPVWLDDAFDLRFTAPGAPLPVSVIDVSVAGVITDVKEGPGGARDPS